MRYHEKAAALFCIRPSNARAYLAFSSSCAAYRCPCPRAGSVLEAQSRRRSSDGEWACSYSRSVPSLASSKSSDLQREDVSQSRRLHLFNAADFHQYGFAASCRSGGGVRVGQYLYCRLSPTRIISPKRRMCPTGLAV